MTETEWLVSSRPGEMLRGLRGDKLSHRKLRLFACACVRRVLHLTKEPQARTIITNIERFVDGLAGISDFEARWAAVSPVDTDTILDDGEDDVTVEAAAAQIVLHAVLKAESSVYCVMQRTPIVQDRRTIQKHVMAAARAAATAAAILTPHEGKYWPNSTRGEYRSGLTKDERQYQSDLLRDLIGNPFRSRPAVVPSWLDWSDGVVVELAESIYQESAFDRMGILADALEEAGCDHADILNHCRRSGKHARGCWVIDLVLKRE